MRTAPSCMFVRYFCDYQRETLGECLYRQYLNPLVCFEVLISLCMYSLLGTAFVVNHLALSEMDSLCRPGRISPQEPLPACRVQETRPGLAFSVLYSPCCPGKTCTFKCKAHSRHIWIHSKKTVTLVACKKGIMLFQTLWEKNPHNRNQIQK